MQLTRVFTQESEMIKKILILFTITMILVVSATPAVAQKPTENNGNANKTHENRGKANEPSKKETTQNPAKPNADGITISSSSSENKVTSFGNNTKGFDESGYNRTARIFNGTAWGWCMEKVGDEAWCENYLGNSANDHLVMKWNAEWDRGNAENWSEPPYNAWENNQWNGKVPNGSGEVWHYKIVWVGQCGADGTPLENGGYCIWGQFEVLMEHGTSGNVHEWFTHAIPNGYGSYP
jgi:hypothetical protein